jgi:tetratricopeptide (TPR) repeat protein
MKELNFQRLFFCLIVVAFFSGCDSKKNEAASLPAPKVENVVPAPDPSAEARASLNQAFAYISSAKVAPNKAARDELLNNAEVELSAAIEKKPDYVEALSNRGVIYITLGKLNKAEEDLKRAVQINPTHADSLYNLACLYSLTKKLDLAADALSQSLASGFNDAERLRNDPDLNLLRSTKQFSEILERNKIFIGK